MVLFVNLNFDLEFKAAAEATLERSYTHTHDYTIDFSDFGFQQKTTYDSPGWQVSAVLSGDIGLRTTLEICMGLYGKILSLRIFPSIYGGIHAESAPLIIVGNDDEPAYDVSAKPGITPKVNWQLDAGLVLELSVFDWFKELFGKLTKENTKSVLKEASEQAKNYIQEHNLTETFWNNIEEDKYTREEDKENSALTVNIGKWDIVKAKPLSWFPTIDDNSFKVNSTYLLLAFIATTTLTVCSCGSSRTSSGGYGTSLGVNVEDRSYINYDVVPVGDIITYTIDISTPEGKQKLNGLTENEAKRLAEIEARRKYNCDLIINPQFDCLKKGKRILRVTIDGRPGNYKSRGN